MVSEEHVRGLWPTVTRWWEELKPHRRPVIGLCVVVACVVTGGVWWWAAEHYSERLKVMAERVQSKDDQIALWKDKAQAATPEDAAIKLKAMQGTIDGLKESVAAIVTPKLDEKDPVWSERNGKVVYTKEVQVNSSFVREGLTLMVKAEGIESVQITPLNDPDARMIETPAKDGYRTFWIKHPYGRYAMEVVLKKKTPVDFKWSF